MAASQLVLPPAEPPSQRPYHRNLSDYPPAEREKLQQWVKRYTGTTCRSDSGTAEQIPVPNGITVEDNLRIILKALKESEDELQMYGMKSSVYRDGKTVFTIIQSVVKPNRTILEITSFDGMPPRSLFNLDCPLVGPLRISSTAKLVYPKK